MSLTVLIGGARSGKSSLAVRLAVETRLPVTFIATGEPGDDEMRERIAAHKSERPPEWTTVEEPVELQNAIEQAPPGALVIDCLSLWLANVLGTADVEEAAAAAARAAARREGPTFAVSNEVGLGVVPATKLGRAYRDALGRVNAAWVDAADRAYFVVAGRALALEQVL